MNLKPLANVTALSSRVVRILGQNASAGHLQGTNTYLVGTGSRRILIDTGENNDTCCAEFNVSKYQEILRQELMSRGVKLELLLLTHWHPDHTGGVNGILDKLSVGNLLSDDIKVRKFPCSNNEETRLPFVNEYTSELQHGEKICTEGATLRVLHTPGHSSDHSSFFLEEEQSLFTGDCILGESTSIVENLKDYMNSLEIYRSIEPKVKTLYPGHGSEIPHGLVRIEEYVNHRLKREDQILQSVKSGCNTKESILDVVYVGLSEQLRMSALQNIKVHLDKLIEDGKVSHDDSKAQYFYIDTN